MTLRRSHQGLKWRGALLTWLLFQRLFRSEKKLLKFGNWITSNAEIRQYWRSKSLQWPTQNKHTNERRTLESSVTASLLSGLLSAVPSEDCNANLFPRRSGAESRALRDHSVGVQTSCEKCSRGEISHTYALPLTTRPREKNVSRYGKSALEWTEEGWKNETVLGGRQSETGRREEGDGGCGPYLYLGDIVLVWADVGAWSEATFPDADTRRRGGTHTRA